MGDMRGNNTASLEKSFAMNGGNGTLSYSRNSTVQREGFMVVKALIDEVISEKLEMKNLSTSSADTFCIADLGCSVGPNTVIAMENIIAAVEKKYQSEEGFSNSELPEFQVLFNDQTKNDFNTLFACIPRERNYLVAGIPGSFHGRLFPKSSIHIAHSSFAFHWLSDIPKDVLRRDSPAWNKGKIFYTSASDEVGDAYAAQFARDIDTILNARAKEIVAGGLLIILLAAIPDGIHRSEAGFGLFIDDLGTSLMDMACEGLIKKDQVDTFNLPMYFTNRKEMKGVVENNGCFSIERMELTETEPIDAEKLVSHARAALEGIIEAHFGGEIIDDLFCRFNQKATIFMNLDEKYGKGNMLFLALKRKSSFPCYQVSVY